MFSDLLNARLALWENCPISPATPHDPLEPTFQWEKHCFPCGKHHHSDRVSVQVWFFLKRSKCHRHLTLVQIGSLTTK